MIEPFLTMLWWIAKAVAFAAVWTLVPAAIAVLFYYVVMPESRDPHPQMAKCLARWPSDGYVTGPSADVSAATWEDTEAYRQMVEDACERLHSSSIGQRFTANRGADHTAIHDISVTEHLRLLEQYPACYE